MPNVHDTVGLVAAEAVQHLIASIDIFEFLDQMPDHVVITDLEGRILYLNRITQRLEMGDLQGVPMYASVRTQDQHRIVAAMRRAAATGRAQRTEATSAFSDAVFEGTITPLYDHEHHVVGFINVARDITAVRAAKRMLTERIEAEEVMSAELRRIDATRTEFVARVTHDLRTPITAVYGFAETLQHRWDDLTEADRLAMLGLIASGADRLQQLVSQTLEVSRIESGETIPVIEPFDMVTTSRELCAELNGVPPQNRIKFEAHDGEPLVAGDEALYSRVLTNLLGNALKFSAPEESVLVTVTRHDNEMRAHVRDWGMGIAPEDLPRLFRKFSQVGAHRNSANGTGLGLYICKALMEAQKGSIHVESVLGEGTTMTVRLRIAE